LFGHLFISGIASLELHTLLKGDLLKSWLSTGDGVLIQKAAIPHIIYLLAKERAG